MNSTDSTYFARLVLRSDQDAYEQYMRIVAMATWDEDEREWVGVDNATKALEGWVRELDPDAPGFSDLRKIDYDAVDYRVLITDELDELEP